LEEIEWAVDAFAVEFRVGVDIWQNLLVPDEQSQEEASQKAFDENLEEVEPLVMVGSQRDCE
jgi:hypothetical protein